MSSPCGRPRADIVVNHESLGRALTWLLTPSIFAVSRTGANVLWKSRTLACAAVLWVWGDEATLTKRFVTARKLVIKLFRWQEAPGTCYQGFTKALRRRTAGLFEVMFPHFRQIMRQCGGSFWTVGGWIVLAVDGSRVETPRTKANEGRLLVDDQRVAQARRVAAELVEASSGLCEKRHKKTLQLDPARPDGKKKASKQERLALQKKQAKIKTTLGLFDEVLRPLETLAEMQHRERQQSDAGPDTPDGARPESQLPEGFQAEYEAAPTADARYQVIGRYFDLNTVCSDEDIRCETFYYVRGRECHLIRSSPGEPRADPVSMRVVPSGQRMKPVPRRKLLELGINARLLRLVPKAKAEATREPGLADSEHDSAEDDSDAPIAAPRSYTDCLVDLGSLTQLLTAVRQSDLIAAADQIAHVRDREFRMGRYRAAFDIIERLSVKFRQAATARQQSLRTEEIQYKSGVLKMSPKKWQQKRRRDTAQTQIIERARRQFARVLDGLRVFIVSK